MKMANWMRAGLAMLALAGWMTARAEEKDPNRTDGYEGPKEGVFKGLVQKSEQEHRLIVKGDDGTRHFFPHWRGGMPADGGGFDKAMLEVFKKLNAGDQIEVKWTADERFRAEEVKVVKKAEPKPEEKEKAK